MEKKDIFLLLLIIGSIITIIFGIDLVRLVFLLFAELGVTFLEAAPIARMAVGVLVITMIIFPILIIIFNILIIKVLEENKIIGILFGFLTLIFCIIAMIFSIFFIIIADTLPQNGAVNIVMRMRGSLGVCIVGQILVLIGAILNLPDQFNK